MEWLARFFFNDTATTEIYTLSLHDALPILLSGPSTFVLSYSGHIQSLVNPPGNPKAHYWTDGKPGPDPHAWRASARSEEHTSELQSRQYLVCRLLLEKKIKYFITRIGRYLH